MQVNFLILTICFACYFFFSSSSSSSTSAGWNAERIYLDLFEIFLTAVALLFLEIWAPDPTRRPRAVSELTLVPIVVILAFDSCGVLFDGAGGLDHYFLAYLLLLAGVAAVFARVCVAGDGRAGTGSAAALLVFLFLKLGAAVVFSCYPIEGTDGGDGDLLRFVLLAAGAMLALAYM